jgi:hypothetical protein
MTKAKKSYTEMLKDELLEVARRLGLTNLSKLRKDEIVDLLETAERAKPSKPAAPKSKSAPAPASKGLARSEKPDAPKPVPLKPVKPTAKPDAPKPVASKPAATKPDAPKPVAQKPAAPKPVAQKSATPTSQVPLERPVARTPAKPVDSRPPQKHAGPTPNLGPVSAQAGAQASKYAHYRPEELQGIDESLPDLPETYGDNRIVLLPRDLAWLFAYWDLATEYKDAARAAGGNVLALRLYDVTGIDFDGTNARAMVEHECAEWARSWYLPTPAPDRDYVVEIGYRGADQWFPLARSNKVSVPSDQPSTWIKDDFITIRFEEDLRQPEVRERLLPQGGPGPGLAAAGTGAVGPHTLFDDGELRVVVGGTFLPPSGAPTWPSFSGSAELAALPSSQSLVAGSLLGIPTSGAWSGVWSGVWSGAVPGSGQAFVPGSLISLPSSGAFSGPGFFQLPTSGGFQRPGLGPSLPGGELPLAEGARAIGDGGAPTDGSSVSVSTPPPPPPLLVANVEMVISGRSLPGTEIRVAGRAVPLGPDGAFSLRVTVPEGLRELPIEARSPSSPEPRRITLKLGRETDG